MKSGEKTSAWRGLAVVALSIALSACGFQLRGAQPLPFESIYLGLSDASEIGAALKRNIRAVGNTRIADRPQEAQAVMSVTTETTEKRILSLNSSGRVREYQLVYRFGFQVRDNKGREFLPQNEIVLTRDISFNDDRVLAKESEEALLYRDMRADLVQQIMRRLAAAKLAEARE